jgi:hypothetical protein
LQDPTHHKQLLLPFEFISFGITEGKMYKHFQNNGTFVTPINTLRRRWGNNVVYGSLFYCPDINFYLRVLDAYHICSLSTLKKNHINDIHHRIITNITPIYFNTLDELSRLKYKEGKPISAYMYLGNTIQPKLARRIKHPYLSHRVIDGIDIKHFKNLYKEVKN